MRSYYTIIALELAREHAAKAKAQRHFTHPGEPRTAWLRRVIARIALAVGNVARPRANRADDAEVGRVPMGDVMINLLGGRHRS